MQKRFSSRRQSMAGCKPAIGSQLEISTCIPLCHHTSCGIRLHEILVEDYIKMGGNVSTVWRIYFHLFLLEIYFLQFIWCNIIEHVRNMGIWVIFGDRVQKITITVEVLSSQGSCVQSHDKYSVYRYRMELYNHRFITSQSRKRNQVAIVESMIVSQISQQNIFAMCVINAIW